MAWRDHLGATLGSSYVGILAAGMLVFAIAPLSRFADRIAEKAVPLPLLDAQRSESYRDAVRLALRAGITQEEERTLARLARDLGIDAYQALLVRQELESEAKTKNGRSSGGVL